jgi:polyisoprenyl-teichoic acid--peptidoglycan teichoic acid transferase
MKKIPVILILFLILMMVLFIVFQNVGIDRLFKSDVHFISEYDQLNQPTPFKPFYPTITPTSAGFTVIHALVPSAGYQAPAGQINILILGSDYRANQGSRTDVILLVSIFTRENKISLLSFPRDLYVELPGFGQERINTAQSRGGFALSKATFEYNFGIHLDHYLITNFSGFQAIIDTLSGIDIIAARKLTDRCDLPYRHGGYCTVNPGPYHLDGALALWYVRSRYSTSDIDRMRRAQEVMGGMFNKLMSWNAVSRAPELYNLFKNNIESDMSLTDILPLLPVASAIQGDPSRIKRYSIDLNQAKATISKTTGAYLLIPDYNAIWQTVFQAVYTP